MKWSVQARAVIAALASVIALGGSAPGCGGGHGSAATEGSNSTPAAGEAGDTSAQAGDYSSSSAGTGGHHALVAGGASSVDLGTAVEGEAGEGGKGALGGDPIVYDFEDGLDGWSSTDAGVQVNVSAEKFLTGSQSLHVAMPALTAGTVRNISVFNAPFWPGTQLTMSMWVPAGSDGLSVNGFTSSNNDQSWDVAGNSAITLTRGGWTTWTYTVPQTFPGGLQTLGVQVGVKPGGKAFGGGDLYVDSIRASGGTRDCTGMPSGTFDFEGTGDTGWALEEDAMASVPDDTSIASVAVDADHHGMDAKALEISFTNLPPPDPGGQTRRLLVLHDPDARCGQEVIFNIWAPAGSDLMLIQTFAQYDNGDMDIETVETLTRNGWSQFGYTIPDVGPGGLQSIGLQFVYVGTEPYTGKLYADNIGW